MDDVLRIFPPSEACTTILYAPLLPPSSERRSLAALITPLLLFRMNLSASAPLMEYSIRLFSALSASLAITPQTNSPESEKNELIIFVK